MMKSAKQEQHLKRSPVRLSSETRRIRMPRLKKFSESCVDTSKHNMVRCNQPRETRRTLSNWSLLKIDNFIHRSPLYLLQRPIGAAGISKNDL